MRALKIVFLFISLSLGNNVFSLTVYTSKTVEKHHKSTCNYLKYSEKEYKLSNLKALDFLTYSIRKPNKNHLLQTRQ